VLILDSNEVVLRELINKTNNQCIRLKFFRHLYVNKKYIFYDYIWVCCGFDVTVIYNLTAN